MITTLADLIGRHGVDVDAHLDRDALVPVSSQPQIQGDVAVWPTASPDTNPGTPVPREGVVVVRGEAGGHTHLLLTDADMTCWYQPNTSAGQRLGVLTVPAGGVAYLAHPEHGYLGVGQGVYVLTRQREQADEIRMVAD